MAAFTRRPESFPIENGRLEVVGGDVHDAVAVARAIAVATPGARTRR